MDCYVRVPRGWERCRICRNRHEYDQTLNVKYDKAIASSGRRPMMNRLKDLGCYLSGPIDFADDEGKGWRDKVSEFLEERNVKVYNPLEPMFHGINEAEDRPKMKRLKEEGRMDEFREMMKVFVHADLRAVDLSSFVIINFDTSIFMCGSIEEMFKGNTQQKPILVMAPQGEKNCSTWLLGRIPSEHIFESWDELFAYLDDINSNPDYEFTKADNKRWLFHAGEHMYCKELA